MNVGQMTEKVRLWTRLTSTNANTDGIIREVLHTAYQDLVSEFATQFPDLFVEATDLTLTGVYTNLPSAVELITRVELISTSAQVQNRPGRELPQVDSRDRSAAPVTGYFLVDRTIGLTNLTATDRVLRIFYRPDVEEFVNSADIPRLIPHLHHMAIVWYASFMLQGRDNAPTEFIVNQHRVTKSQLYAAMAHASNTMRL